MDLLFGVIHDSAELLVVNKPAGLVCHPTKGDVYSSLISRARIFLERRGDARSIHLVNRLDRETSGLVLLARGADVAAELGRLWERREVEKSYLAVVHGEVKPELGSIEAPLGRDEMSRVAIKDRVRTDGAPALTNYRVLRHFDRENVCFSLLEIVPMTGRKHQIRIHLAHRGHPIVGDKLYGGDDDDYLALVEDRMTPEIRRRLILPFQALHAAKLEFAWRGVSFAFEASPEPWFRQFVGSPVSSEF